MSTRTMGLSLVRILNGTGLLLALTLALLVLAACDSSEDRAEEHYESGMELLANGDVERALVEFRNVFRLDNQHHGARLAYAKIQRDRGDLKDAYGQYTRLVEQYPDDLDGQIALSEIALQFGDFEELERHTRKAEELAPDNLKVKSLSNTMKYYFARRDSDQQAMTDSVVLAQQLIDQEGDLPGARKIVIDNLISNSQWEEALTELGKAIDENPSDMLLYRLRVGVLEQLGDRDGIREQIELINERFPNDPAIEEALVRFYMQEQDLDAAEAFLRAKAEASDDPKLSRQLVNFILQFRGADAAISELNNILSQGRMSPIPFRTMLATLKFQKGDQEEAIAELESVDKDAPRTAEIRDLETDLAIMYFQRGNSVAARRLVEQVLAEDPSHPGASKLKASWLIQDDETGDAIILLRDALGQAPRDSDLLTLLAQAHQREGNRALMTETLALAVDASNKAPTESIRYAQALIESGQELSAEGVLIDALRVASTNLDLLSALGQLYIRMENWPQASGVIDRLNELDTERSKAVALSLNATSLSAQGRNDDLLEMLQGVAENPDTKKAGLIAIFRTHLKEDGPEFALGYLNGLLEQSPEDPDYQFLRAGLFVILNRDDEAEAAYRQLADRFPQSTRVWTSMYRMKMVRGKNEEANAILQEALSKNPDDPRLQITLAQELQNAGNFEGAIEIYEALYAQSTESVLVANNLASMLADHRKDEESLKRAYAVARRLKGTENPPLQDTYGWIAFRLGNHEESLPYLEGAANGMPDDSRVQYHYGASLAANGRTAEALEQLNHTLDMIDEANPPDFYDDLRKEIEKLEEPATPEANE